MRNAGRAFLCDEHRRVILPGSLHSGDFVGRREELALLHEEFRAACDGAARFVVIEGEAGIGKSRLIEELVKCSGARRVSGACVEQIRSPYLPIVDVLEQIAPERAWEPQKLAKSAFFEGAADAIRACGAPAPLLVTIEDLQWADGATLELLGFLLARLGRTPVLMLLSLRAETYVTVPALAGFRAAAARSRSLFLQLRPLRGNDVRNLVQHSAARRGSRLASGTVSQIETLAEGNPLFAEELARIAIENGELTLRPQRSFSVAAILGERLAAFDEAERACLIRAAIVGLSFDVPLLATIAGVSEANLLGLMQRSVERGLVVEDGQSPLRFRFKHALIRKALADRLVVALAAPLHVRIAQALQSRADDYSRTAELAYHWSAARRAEEARIWNERAGAQAWSMYAYRDAIRFYTEALRWEYPAGRERAQIYEHLGTLHYIDGSAQEPAQYFERCRAEYERAGDEEGAARAVWLLADQHWVDARTVDGLAAATEAAARARKLRNSELEAGAVLSMARFAVTLGRPEEALVHLAAAQRHEEGMDSVMRASLHEIRGEIFAVQGRTREALADLLAATAMASQTGSPELVAQIENNAALGAVDLGEYPTALSRHRRAVEEADRTAMTWRVAYCSLGYARTLMLTGNFEAARDCVWSALETGVSTATFKTKAAAVGIPLALRMNDLALLEACAREEALDLARDSGEVQRIAGVSAAFAELRAEQGAFGEARAMVADALARVSRAHRAWDLLLCAARYGAPADAAAARALLKTALGRPRLRRGYRLLFEAIMGRAKDRAAARRMACAAEKQFRLMGDLLHASQAGELSSSLADPPKAAQVPAQLTPRQMQIAELVALGETNRAIAARLQISEHTVEHHLSAIFERWKLKSRAQLAHAMARRPAQ